MNLSLFAAAQEAPARIALVDAETSWTFAELAGEVRREIARLHSRGLALPGAPRVASVEARLARPSVVTILALIECGHPFLPFLPFHPQLGDAERRALAALVGPLFDAGAGAGDDPGAACCPGALPRIEDDARPLAFVATSGTSGAPRIAELSRAAFAAAARASQEHIGWGEDERWLASLPLSHVGGLSIVTRCLFGRGTLALASGTGARELAESFARHEPTLASLVPAMLDRLLASEPSWRPPAATRAILLGGAAAPATLVEKALERGLPILLTYGMTESCAQAATARPGEDPRRLVPLPGVEVRVGAEGLELRAPSLATRVLPREADERAWSGEGWMKTSDLGVLREDGSLSIEGRRDDVIVSGGEKVSPREVEDALRACPGVADALAFGEPDERWGEVVAAALIPEGERRPSGEELRACLRQRLARFKHPRAVAWLERFPLSALGKVERRAVIHAARPELRTL